MKKILISVLVLSLLLLCGCGGTPAATPGDAFATPGDAFATDGDAAATDGNAVAAPGNGAEDPVEFPEEDSARTANPVEEMTAEEVLEATGFLPVAPEDSQNAVFSVLHLDDIDVAQMNFDRGGVSITLRVCFAGIPEGEPGDISGLFYNWANTEETEIGYNHAWLHWNEGEAGYITWYDFAPGLLYMVSVDNAADAHLLTTLAEELYQPVQGEVG